MNSQSVTIQISESYYAAISVLALFIMLYKMVLRLESVDEIRKCNSSNESYRAIFPVVLFITLHK